MYELERLVLISPNYQVSLQELPHILLSSVLSRKKSVKMVSDMNVSPIILHSRINTMALYTFHIALDSLLSHWKRWFPMIDDLLWCSPLSLFMIVCFIVYSIVSYINQVFNKYFLLHEIMSCRKGKILFWDQF